MAYTLLLNGHHVEVTSWHRSGCCGCMTFRHPFPLYLSYRSSLAARHRKGTPRGCLLVEGWHPRRHYAKRFIMRRWIGRAVSRVIGMNWRRHRRPGSRWCNCCTRARRSPCSMAVAIAIVIRPWRCATGCWNRSRQTSKTAIEGPAEGDLLIRRGLDFQCLDLPLGVVADQDMLPGLEVA